MSSEGSNTPVLRVSSDEFRRASGRFATGITIATVRDSEGQPHGLTVNSFTSVSLEPPLVSICLGHAVKLIDRFREATHYGINMLADSQKNLSVQFAMRGHDRFEGVDWAPGPHGAPLIAGVLAALECRIVERIPAGDHDIFLAELETAQITDGQPLIYFASEYRQLGNERP